MTGTELGTVGLLVVFPVLAAILGAVLAAFHPPNARLTSGVQHFAAGAVLAAIALDVLPGLHKQGHLAIAAAGFALGAAILLGVRQWETHGGAGASDQQPAGCPSACSSRSALTCCSTESWSDSASPPWDGAQGVALTVALTLVILPLALSVTVELTHRGMRAVRAALIPPLLSLALVVGAIGAVVVLGSAPAALLAGILAFGVAALLFLAAEELLVEAHETIDTPILAAMFFIGFFALYILDASH